MSKVFVVVGATGQQGSAAVDYFLKHEPSYKIRGLTRKPTSDAATNLSNKGVEVVQANLDDVESLKKAFTGANGIFAYTSFNDIAFSQPAMGAFQSGKVTPLGKAAYNIELQQGKNIADAAAGTLELERLVWSSLSDVSKLSKGKYKGVYHFDSKAAATDYMLGLKGLEGKVSTVQMGSFADNAARFPEIYGFRKEREDSYVLKMPLDGDTTAPWIDVPRDGGAFVAALLKAPAGTHVVGASEYLSGKQWLSQWASTVGAKARFERISVEEFCGDDPTGFVHEQAEMFAYVEEFGFHGNDPDILTPDEFEQKTGVKIPRSKISDHIRQHDWSAILKLDGGSDLLKTG